MGCGAHVDMFNLQDHTRKVLWSKGHRLRALKGCKATNNAAEYEALGLLATFLYGVARGENPALAREITSRRVLTIVGDSQLVINQMNGSIAVKAPHLISLFNNIIETISAVREMLGIEVRYRWTPRDNNKRADSIANAALAHDDANIDSATTSGSSSSGSSSGSGGSGSRGRGSSGGSGSGSGSGRCSRSSGSSGNSTTTTTTTATTTRQCAA
jgi:ribonuclease HI